METFLKTTTVTNNLKLFKNVKLTYNCYTSLPKHFLNVTWSNFIKKFQNIFQKKIPQLNLNLKWEDLC